MISSHIIFQINPKVFLNGILTNTEIWYGVTKAELKVEDLDLILLKGIFNTIFSVHSVGVYLEGKKVQLHYLVNQ